MFRVAACFLLAVFCLEDGPAQELVPGISSGNSTTDLVRKEWKLSGESKVDDGVRPKFHHQEFVVEDATVLGVPTDLKVWFFNDQLMQVVLYPRTPSDLDRARVAVSSMHRIDLAELRDGARSGGLEVQEQVDMQGRSYITITVRSVDEKYTNWIKAYS